MKKFKTSFFINFIGLSTGLACAFFIYLWVKDEMEYDKFHVNEKQLFQVMELSKENGEMVVHDGTQGMLAETMAKDFPEIEYASPMMSLYKEGTRIEIGQNQKMLKAYPSFVAKDFLKMFSFPLLAGDKTKALSERNNVVITKKYAISIFGSVDAAMGKTLDYELFGTKRQATVSAVLYDLPANSSIKFDLAFTHELLVNDIWTNGQKWWNTGPVTYLQLKKGTDVAKFNSKIEKFIYKYYPQNMYSIFLRPYSSGYLNGNYENGKQAGGRIEYVQLFSVIAIIILIVACINFMNLSTARASRRMKEVGIKKAVGSSRMTLVFQFLCEAMLVVLASMIAACVLVAILLPAFNNITGKQIILDFNGQLLMMLFITMLTTGVLSGSYPAFYLSAFNPVVVLKGRPKNSLSELLARKGLVVFQFAVSLFLLVSVMVVYQQMKYIQSKNVGYDRTSMLSFERSGKIMVNSEAFLQDLRQTPGVINASLLGRRLAQSGNGSSTYGISWPGKEEGLKVDFAITPIDYGLVNTLGLKIIAGRDFSPKFGSDSSNLLFNETAIRIMGLKNPIGSVVKMWGEDMTIVGVVKDFHISSLHEAIGPMVFRYRPEQTSLVITKIQAGKEKETIAHVENLFKKYNPGGPFEYSFLDDEYRAQYVSEERISVLARYFAGLAVLIMCLGLFGLAAFNAEVRTKEIGIRKVLGATTATLVGLLSKDFFKLVAISILVAFPTAWLVMSKWLSGFAYKIDLDPVIFVIALLAIVLITIVTISYQSIKTAIASPAKSLKAE